MCQKLAPVEFGFYRLEMKESREREVGQVLRLKKWVKGNSEKWDTALEVVGLFARGGS